ncbi:hypothetical protein ACO1O0_005029 [Amphichorda felina]
MGDQVKENDDHLRPSRDESSQDRRGAEESPKPPKFNTNPRFWAIIATLCVISLLSALENTLFGQLANIWGRRYVTLSIIALFTLGSGIAGGAKNAASLIAGRAVQGMGSGGINMIVDVIVSDLVPLRERGNYIAFVLTVYFVGTAVGPYVGGAIIETTSWRWVFYINLPIGGASMIMILLFLQVKYKKEMSFAQKLGRIDYIGNLLLIASTVSVLYAMTYGGTREPWSSWRTILPLVLGLLGLCLFVWVETLSFIKEPVVPPRLFANRTSVTVFAVTFLNSALLYWMLFFLPVYFQAVLGSSPARSGVQLLPAIAIAVPFAIVAVLLLAKFGKYKPLHFFGFALNTIGLGLFALLDEHSSMAEWVIFQIIAAGGSGFVLNTLLPACQTPLDEKDQAAATSAWSFVRSFGNIWGVAIPPRVPIPIRMHYVPLTNTYLSKPAAIFNNYFDKLSDRISDQDVAAQFRNGKAYESVSADLINSFPEPVKSEIVGVYSESLKYVWRLSIIFAGLAFFLVFVEKQLHMRTELETEFGLDEGKNDETEPESGEKVVSTTRKDDATTE